MDRSIDLAVQRMPISLGQKPWSWTLSGGEQLIYLVSIGGLENSKNYFQRNAVWRDSSTYYVIHCHSCLFIAKLNSRIQVILGAAGYYYLKYLWFFVGPLSVRPRRGVFTSHSSCDDRSNESNAVQLFTSNASQTHITIV